MGGMIETDKMLAHVESCAVCQAAHLPTGTKFAECCDTYSDMFNNVIDFECSEGPWEEEGVDYICPLCDGPNDEKFSGDGAKKGSGDRDREGDGEEVETESGEGQTLVSQSVRKQETTSPDSLSQQSEERTPYFSARVGGSMSHEDINIASRLYMELMPNGLLTEENIVATFELAADFGNQYLRDIWAWNHSHKTGGLRFTSIQHMATALRSESENNVQTQFADHDPNECPKCQKRKKAAAANSEDNRITRAEFDEIVPVGKGFDPEEA
jgi:hypothetical protein